MGADADSLAEQIVGELENVLEAQADWQEAVRASLRALREARRAYHWIGLYLLRGEELELGPYLGAQTQHERIPVGRGVCGTAVTEGQNINVPDVTALDNYLMCSPKVQSELVVLVRDGVDGRILGEIDVDSHKPAAFGADDERLLGRLAERLARVPEVRAS
jgi:L-methionine (R)-S-oxide reductase